MNTTIQPATLSDCEDIYPLICQLAGGGRDGTGSEYRPSYDSYVATYSQIMADLNKHYFVARNENSIVGVAGVFIDQSLVESGNVAYIKELIVDESNRRIGVGQALLSVCIDCAKEHGCQSVVLTTGEKRYAAQRLYEKTGFMKIGVKYMLDI